MFCFFVIWSSLFNMYVLEGSLRGAGGGNSNWLFKTKWIFPFRSFPNSFTHRPWLLALCLTVRLFALCSSPPPSWRVVEEAVVLCAEVKHFAKGLPAAHSHCTAGEAKPTFRASPRFIFVFFFFMRQNYCCRFELSNRLRRIVLDSFFFLLLHQLNAWWEVRGVTTTS